MDEAMRRFAVLRPHIEDAVSVITAARTADVSLRTAQRWLARYRAFGLKGLERQRRSDAETRKLPHELMCLIDGLALRKSRLSCAAIHRRVTAVAKAQDWRVPTYSTIYDIICALQPAMVTLAQDGAAAYRDRYKLIYRHRATAPNALWQADHTMLDILVLDANGTAVRPWLTVIMDDLSGKLAPKAVLRGLFGFGY